MIFYYLLAFLIPFPLFIDLANLSFIVEPADGSMLIISGVPIPICMVSLLLIVLPSLRKIGAFLATKNLLFISSSLLCFLLLGFQRINNLKILAVVAPLFILLVFTFVIKNPKILPVICKGYVSGAFVLGCLHTVSIVINSFDYSLLASSRSFFGYEIYQAWVSYSAVISLIASALVIYLMSSRKTSLLPIILLACFPFYVIVIALGRKAALLDLFLVCFISLACFFRCFNYKMPHLLSKRVLIILPALTSLSLAIFAFTSLSNRPLDLEYSITQRGYHYEIFWDQIDPSTFLFGFSAGWGGFSNFFIELIARTGLVGMLLLLLPFAMAIVYFFRALFLYASKNIKLDSDLYFVKIWFVFSSTTFIASNLYNMNFQLPYYVINFLFVNASFVYFLTRVFSAKSHFPTRLLP